MFISVYKIGQLHFPILEKCSSVGDILWVPAANCPLVTIAICSMDALCVSCMGPSVVEELTIVGMLACRAGPQPSWLPGPALCGAVLPAGG